jgi:drug/metabolite transporter (DMT)-like permease
MNLWFPFALVVGGNVLYHLSQKAVPKGLNPFSAVALAYVVSLALSAALALRAESGQAAQALRSPAVWGIGLAAFIIEAGYLLLYRAGGAVSTAPVAANACVFLLLIPIGLLWFKEKFTWEMAAGVALCTLGLWLIMRSGARPA